MKIKRFSTNPLFTPSDQRASQPDLEAMCTFNPAAAMFKGKRLLLLRVAEKAIAEPGCIAAPIMDTQSGKIEVKQSKLHDPDLVDTAPRDFSDKATLYLTSLSHFRVATSDDGLNITIDEQPAWLSQGSYEREGFMPDAVFHYGTIDTGDGYLELYYGGADLVTCGARIQTDELLAHSS